VLDDIDAGRLDPGEQLGVADSDLVADSGLLQHLDQQAMPVLDLCRFVGAVSDNLATNVLIRRVGLERVDEVAERLGMTRCRLHDIVRDVRTAEHPSHLSTGAASELADLVRRIRIGHAISRVASVALVDLLRLNTDLSMVAAAFGLDPLAHLDDDLGVRLFNKTGTQTGTRADVGCVEATVAGEWRLVSYAVIARFEDSMSTRRAVLDAMRGVGERIADQLQDQVAAG
jgi:beta-lactamase class A